jgi:RimJ/RimL family protein N-acetyltransferase
MKLTTERLKLRPIEAKDAESVFEYRSDYDANKYQGWIPKKVEEVYVLINDCAGEPDVPDTWFQFVIYEKKMKKIIGDLGVHFIGDKQAEIGCTIAKQHQEKGYATEAIKAVIDYIFKKLGKHRIIASMDPQNIAIMNLLEKIGFRKEAHFKESYYQDGYWYDDVIYAILNKEWGNN